MIDEIKQLRIILSNGIEIEFKGFYRRSLEKENWYYYQTHKGDILYFRKDHIEAVLEGKVYEVSYNSFD